MGHSVYSVILVVVSVVTDRHRRVLLDMLCVGGDLLPEFVETLQRRPIGLCCEVEFAFVT